MSFLLNSILCLWDEYTLRVRLLGACHATLHMRLTTKFPVLLDEGARADWPLSCPPLLSEAVPASSISQVLESCHKLHRGFFSRVKGVEAV